MGTRRNTRKSLQPVAGWLATFLLLFSGVVNAYCAIDEGIARADGMASAQHLHEGGADDACPGLPVPDKEDAKPCAQWDVVPDRASRAEHAVSPVSQIVAVVARREPIAERVFLRFPRLLN